MKNLFNLFVLFSINLIFSQADSTEVIRVEYIRKLTPANSARVYTSYYALNAYPEKNISIFDKTSKVSNPNEVVNDNDDDSVFYFTPSGKNISLVYKNYSANELYSKKDIAFKYFTIKDSLNIFNWEIKDDMTEILGYKCQMAIMNFRGRNYKAWFTTDLIQGGPWKYDGLPGMILKIETENQFISFEAIRIRGKKLPDEDLKNPFKSDKNILTWEKFKSLYKEKAIALSKYSTESGGNSGIIMPRMGIERYIEEDDKDYKADKKFFEDIENNKN